MATMENLHLNWNWLAMLVAVICIFAGLQGIVRSDLALIASLRISRDKVALESGQRHSVEAALESTEDLLNQALEASRIGTWALDPQTRELVCSDGIEEIIGVPSDTFDGTLDSYLKLIHPGDVDRVRQNGRRALESGSPYEEEHRIVVGDGSVRWIKGKGRSLLDAEGNPLRMSGVVWDVSSFKEAANARQAARAETEALAGLTRRRQRMESLGTLAGGIAHDFNNLLTPILAHADLLAGDPEAAPQTKDRLDQIRIAAERAKGLARQILAFGGRSETSRTTLNVSKVAEETLDLVRATVPTTIELRRSLQPGLQANGDSTQLTQAILNLCTNAAQSMPGGGVLQVSLTAVEVDEVVVAAHPELTVGRKIRLTVTDSGHGIPSDVIENVFDPFFTTKPVGEGTGLGLAQVHGIVRAHRGTVFLYSELTSGTTVQVFLPLLANAAAQGDGVAGGDSVSLGQERVLVVDDEPAVAAVLGRILESLGYSVHVELDPVSAVTRFQRAPKAFHAVVTDLTMPGMTGLELIDAIRKHTPSVPVLVVSGYAEMTSPALEAPGIGFLMKPFTRSQLSVSLRETIDNVVASPRA